MAATRRSMGRAREYVRREEMHRVFIKLERTRASEARPARARPTCSSRAMTFFWYDDSSSALRCEEVIREMSVELYK